jgi:hypothetical protein
VKKLLIVAVAGLLAVPALAEEADVRLKEGPGRDLVTRNCVMCHSLDYIPMNSPFLDRKGWEASMNKMVKVMGAPVKEEDLPGILDYLVENYGKR